jgi:hypothetical protein
MLFDCPNTGHLEGQLANIVSEEKTGQDSHVDFLPRLTAFLNFEDIDPAKLLHVMGYTEGPGETTLRALGSPSLVTGIPVNKPRAPPLTRPGHISALQSSQVRDAETKRR